MFHSLNLLLVLVLYIVKHDYHTLLLDHVTNDQRKTEIAESIDNVPKNQTVSPKDDEVNRLTPDIAKVKMEEENNAPRQLSQSFSPVCLC